MNQILPIALAASVVFPLVAALSATVIFRRYERSSALLNSRFSLQVWGDELLYVIRYKLSSCLEPSLSSLKQPLDLDAKLSNTGEQEAYGTVGELLNQIEACVDSGFADSPELSAIEAFTKFVYQLQIEMQLPSTDAQQMLSPLAAKLVGKKLYGKVVSVVEFVEPNARVEESIMWPLNSGLRVLQPYGFVIKSEAGGVLSRAKVRCR